jgi:cardiolipin synthase
MREVLGHNLYTMKDILIYIWVFIPTVYLIIKWIIRIWALFVVPVNRKPTAALGWLMVIMLSPVFGFIVFKILGSPKLPVKRRADQRLADKAIHETIQKYASDVKIKPLVEPEIPDQYQIFERLAANLGGLPAFSGNNIEFISDYPKVFDRMIKDIDQAKVFVHIEFYIIAWDASTEPLMLALGEAVKRGVKVRMLFDQFGSRKYPGFDTLVTRIEALGIEIYPMLPVHWRRNDFTRPDLRNHRKIGVIDGQVAYTGSLNLIERAYHRKDEIYYDELVARTTGPVVAQFEAVFLTDWYAETGVLITAKSNPELRLELVAAGRTLAQVLPSGSAFETENNLKLFGSLIHSARKTITIVNPYFVPDESLMMAITGAANRGVRVRLVNSAVSDQFLVSNSQRSYYAELLAAGVEIYLYKAPILLHTKTITIDDRVAIVGSSNFDMRSFTLNLEVTLVAYDPEVVRSLQDIEATYLSRADQVLAQKWQKRSNRHRLYENIARLTSAVQ